ncbi:membrane-spanning 4-domains subfamily A member 8-like [Pelodytes ibericus]
MASPAPAVMVIPQWTGNTQLQPMAVLPANMPSNAYQVLNKGQPKALGVTQIVLAFFMISLGTISFFTTINYLQLTVYTGLTFWGAVLYIISGSLSVAVENKPSRCLTKGFLTMNIISSLTALTSVVIFLLDMFIYECYGNECYGIYDTLNVNRITVLSFLSLASLLQFCVCISLSVFGCKSLSHGSSNPVQVLMIPNDYRSPGPSFNPGFANLYAVPQNIAGQENGGFSMAPPNEQQSPVRSGNSGSTFKVPRRVTQRSFTTGGRHEVAFVIDARMGINNQILRPGFSISNKSNFDNGKPRIGAVGSRRTGKSRYSDIKQPVKRKLSKTATTTRAAGNYPSEPAELLQMLRGQLT